jgi:imidazolonepropionase-like amidohydrolase
MKHRMLMVLICATSIIAPFHASAQTIAITGGKVYPVSGPPIDNGTVLIVNGRITAVGASVAIPAGAQRIDATGKWVTPGLVDAYTQLGLVEIDANGSDASAAGHDHVAASFTAWEGINPASQWFAQSRQDGVTNVVVTPTGGLIGGQAAFVDIVRGTMRDMVKRSPVGMVAEVGDAGSAGVGARAEVIAKMRDILSDARYYRTHRADYDRAQVRALATTRADLEALQAVLAGTEPLIVTANLRADIEAALALAHEFSLRLIISGGAEAWMVASELAAAHVPVLTGAMNNIPSSFATLGQRQENAGLLRRAGVDVAIIANSGSPDDETFNVRNIRYEAGNAVSYGMTWDDALRAVTLTPSMLFGVADRVGSLQPGRDGNVVVWSGDPFEPATQSLHVFVRGVEYHDVTRSDLLTQKYFNPGR